MGWHYIYFYGREDGSEVKVGRTKQRPSDRRMQHENQNGHDVPMRTLAIVLGQTADEAAGIGTVFVTSRDIAVAA